MENSLIKLLKVRTTFHKNLGIHGCFFEDQFDRKDPGKAIHVGGMAGGSQPILNLWRRQRKLQPRKHFRNVDVFYPTKAFSRLN
jgi:hypothetical protein